MTNLKSRNSRYAYSSLLFSLLVTLGMTFGKCTFSKESSSQILLARHKQQSKIRCQLYLLSRIPVFINSRSMYIKQIIGISFSILQDIVTYLQ